MQHGLGDVEKVREGLVGRLRARRGELIEAIFARVRDGAFGPAGVHDAEYLAGLRGAVGAAVEYGLAGIERGEDRIGPIPAVATEQARRAARIGVSLDTVLRRYVLGSTLLGDLIMEEVEDGELQGSRSALREMLGAQASVLDRLLVAITGEYEDELARTSRTPEQRRAELVQGMLAGASDLEGTDLGYELEAEHVGVIARGRDVGATMCELADRLDRRLLSVARGQGTTWAWLGGRRGLAMCDLQRAVGELRRVGLSLAVGEPAKGLEGWRLTHRQAQAALAVALQRPRVLTRYGDVALLATALKDEGLARVLVEIYLLPLEDGREGGQVLRETLRAHFACESNTSSTAAAMKVARSTITNRLRTIEERLGRGLHPCPPELAVALDLEQLAPSSWMRKISSSQHSSRDWYKTATRHRSSLHIV
jgi:PucR C-terminal helix-turn-helix domain/GGDEF-like domain